MFVQKSTEMYGNQKYTKLDICTPMVTKVTMMSKFDYKWKESCYKTVV